MHLEYLDEFAAVAADRNLRRAATRLNLAPSTLTRHINQLETELDVVLFERSSDGATLTPAGTAYLDDTQGVLRQLVRAGDVARRIARAEQIRLRIGHTDSAGATTASNAIRAFAIQHPNVSLHLSEAPTADHIDRLLDHRLDIALIHPPVHDARIEEEHLLDETLHAALPAQHRHAKAKTVDLADLAGEPFVLPPRSADPGTHDRILNACRNAGFTPETIHEATTHETITQLVATGIGVALLPAATSTHGQHRVKSLPLTDPITLPLHLAWHRQNTDPTITQALEHLRTSKPRSPGRKRRPT